MSTRLRSLSEPQARLTPPLESPVKEKLISKTSLTTWGTIFKPGGSKALEFNLIQLREGSDKCSRVYLVALGCITAARSLVEAPIALGRLVIEITEWAIDFERTKSELFELIYVEVSDCLRCIKIAFIVTGLTVGGIFFPSSCFGTLKNMPTTVGCLVEEKQLKLFELHRQVAPLQVELTTVKKDLIQVQKKVATEKENLKQILETTGKQGQSLAEAEKLQNKIEKLNKLEVTLNQKLETCKTELEQLNEKHLNAKKTAIAELAAVKNEITTEKETLAKSREVLKALTSEHDGLKGKCDALQLQLKENAIPELIQQQTTLKGDIKQLTAHAAELDKKIQLKETNIADQEKSLEKKKTELEQLQLKITLLKSEVEKYDQMYGEPVRQKIAELQKDKEELEANNKAVEEELKTATAELTDVKREITAEQEALTKSQETHRTLNEKYSRLKSQQQTALLEKLTRETQTKKVKLTEIEKSKLEKGKTTQPVIIRPLPQESKVIEEAKEESVIQQVSSLFSFSPKVKPLEQKGTDNKQVQTPPPSKPTSAAQSSTTTSGKVSSSPEEISEATEEQ
jgi:chromosome segregation ATPase